MHRVVALALPSVVAFDLSIPAQIFGHPTEHDRYDFRVCAETPGLVPSTTQFAVQADEGLEALERADTVVVPGYLPLTDPPEPVLAALRRASDRGARMASVCIGAFALAAAGLLDGRSATTHWQHADDLARRHPEIRVRPDVLYVDEGSVLTSAGITAGIDLCLHLYRNDHGAAAAAEVSRRMVAPMYRPGGQAQYMLRPLPESPRTLARTCSWVLARLDQPLTVDAMARYAGLAPRTFARQFVAETGLTPLRWLTAQRLLEARRLLEGTDITIDEVAHRSGLGSAANLRLRLADDLGTTPSAYRDAFRSAAPPQR